MCELHTLKSALEGGNEARIVQIDFSAAFYRVHNEGTLFNVFFKVMPCEYWLN